MNSVLIKLENSDVTLPIKTWNGKRVVTYDDICQLHNITKERASMAFSRHEKEFKEGVDYFDLTGNEFIQYKDFFETNNLLVSKNNVRGGARKIKLFTESGYFILACTFGGEKAAYIRRVLVDSYFKLREITRDSSKLSVTTLSNLVENQNKMLAAMQQTLVNVNDTMNMLREEHQSMLQLSESVQKGISSLNSGNILNEEIMRDGEATVKYLTERCCWYSNTGNLAIGFMSAVLKSLGINTSMNTDHEDEFSRCASRIINKKRIPVYYVKPAGIQLLVDWCDETNYARDIRQVRRYQRNCSQHKAGDINYSYYPMGGKKWRLKDF